MTAAARVLLVDDHRLVRESLASILQGEADIEVVGDAETGRDSIAQVAALHPDIVIMDLAMRDLNGIEATRQIKRRWPETLVIALSSHCDRRYVVASLRAGVDGYVVKASAYEELCRAVRAVRQGKRYVCPEILDLVVEAGFGTGAVGSQGAGDALTPREREVLSLVAEGCTTADIAERLLISPHTVETHRRKVMKKLRLHNVAELVRYAIREGLASL